MEHGPSQRVGGGAAQARRGKWWEARELLYCGAFSPAFRQSALRRWENVRCIDRDIDRKGERRGRAKRRRSGGEMEMSRSPPLRLQAGGDPERLQPGNPKMERAREPSRSLPFIPSSLFGEGPPDSPPPRFPALLPLFLFLLGSPLHLFTRSLISCSI